MIDTALFVLQVLWVVSPLLIYLGVRENNVMLKKGFKDTIDGLISIEERLSRLEQRAAVGPAPSPTSDTFGRSR